MKKGFYNSKETFLNSKTKIITESTSENKREKKLKKETKIIIITVIKLSLKILFNVKEQYFYSRSKPRGINLWIIQ